MCDLFSLTGIEFPDTICDMTISENHPHGSTESPKTKGPSYSLCVKSKGHHEGLRYEQQIWSLHEVRDTWQKEAVLISLFAGTKGQESLKSICLEAYGWQGRIILEVFSTTNNEILHQIRQHDYISSAKTNPQPTCSLVQSPDCSMEKCVMVMMGHSRVQLSSSI